MNDLRPTDIKSDRKAGEMTVVWNDGATCVYPFDLLRNACPCAQCRGGHENMKSEPDEDMLIIPLLDAKTTRMRSVEAVGSYAINIAWEDGHNYGIYKWEYLRALCELGEDD